MGRYDGGNPFFQPKIEKSTSSGIGINVSDGGTFPMIAGVIDELPAAKAGLKKGDAGNRSQWAVDAGLGL